MKFAPRYDPRLLAALGRLDDPLVPMAETCRRLGRTASRLGLTRPSYVHVRRLILRERLRTAPRMRLQLLLRSLLLLPGRLLARLRTRSLWLRATKSGPPRGVVAAARASPGR